MCILILNEFNRWNTRVQRVESWITANGNLDFRRWKSRIPGFSLYDEVDRVEVGLSLPPPGNLNERVLL